MMYVQRLPAIGLMFLWLVTFTLMPTVASAQQTLTQNTPSTFTKTYARFILAFWDAVGKGADWFSKKTNRTSVLHVEPSAYRYVSQTFYSFNQFMDLVQFHPTWGYYTTRVKQIPNDFTTYPEMLSPYFGQMVAEHAFRMWKTLREHQTLSTTERFTVLEIGGGSGQLAYDFLNHCFQNAQKNSSWHLFYRQLRYVINDISPTMIAQQKEKMKGAPWTNQFETIQGDIRDPKTTTPLGKIKGFVFANELLDDFGAHKTEVSATKDIKLAYVIPVMTFQQMNDLQSQGLSEATHFKIRADDKNIRTQFAIPSWRRGYYLTKDNFNFVINFLYHAAPSKQIQDQLNKLQFQEAYLPIQNVIAFDPSFKEEGTLVQQSMNEAQQNMAVSNNRTPVTIYNQVGVTSFCQGLSNVLEIGYVLLIDYGSSLTQLLAAKQNDFHIRTYPSAGPTPYQYITRKNITTDVNFTHLTNSMRHAGLQPLYYGPQKALQDQTPISFSVSTNTSRETQQAMQTFSITGDPFRLLLTRKNARTPWYLFSNQPNRIEILSPNTFK